MSYGQYEILANFYDGLNSDVDYNKWSLFLKEKFEKYGMKKNSIVLDLGCGTGNITLLLSKLGYDMIGVDLSMQMLDEATLKAKKEKRDILFLNQDMCELDLYGTVDGAVCCLDGVNYITNKRDLEKCFSLVNLFMNDGGVFIFDVNTKYKFENTFGDNTYILEDDDVFCSWQNDYRPRSGLCDFILTFFAKEKNGEYKRYDEIQTERCYSDKDLRQMLNKCGFEIKEVCSDLESSQIRKTSERAFYICVAHNKNKE